MKKFLVMTLLSLGLLVTTVGTINGGGGGGPEHPDPLSVVEQQ
ncbi:hypothetical protein [Litchfieldia alkalitelluris]|nr:hypothetical protein [Litchfieldia alkalitelluris]